LEEQKNMKLYTNKSRKSSGFSLVEMIGVLAIIAILSSLLLPRVFSAINKAKISNSVLTIATIKSAVIEAYSDTGSFTAPGGGVLTVAGLPAVNPFDIQVLMAKQLIDKPFNVKIGVEDPGVNEHEVVIDQPDAGEVTGINVGYDFDGAGTFDDDGDAATPEVPGNDVQDDQYVVYAKIPNVSAQDAFAFSTALDGADLSAASALGTLSDLIGRVKYAAPGAAGVTDVYVYIASR
jgi:prepilin-type N-terminal cleavage/methylation domain-containing protein